MEAFNIISLPFFQWLLKTTAQGSILICLIFLIKAVLRQKLPVRWHYYLWLLLLVRLALPWSPQSRISIFNLLPKSGQRNVPVVVNTENINIAEYPSQASVDTEQPLLISSETANTNIELSETTAISEPSSESGTAGTDRLVFAPTESDSPFIPVFLDILPRLWLIGALALACYISSRNIILWRAVKRERQVTDQQILDLLEDCKMQMQVQTVVGVVVTDKVKSPALFGFIRPRLLLPQGLLEELDFDQLQYVFLHELAHLRRRDIYLGWVVSLLQVLHWFNPLIWFAFRRMRTDQELACDALALSNMNAEEPPRYGKTLVNLFERFSQVTYVPSIAGILEDKSQLERRIKMITLFKKNSYRWSPLAIILIIILGCVSIPNAISTKASDSSNSQSAPLIMIRRVWADADGNLQGAISPDGRYISYVDWDTSGDLAIYEIATNEKRRLTNKDTLDGSDEYAEFSRWSPDGKQIVYDWVNEDGFIELRIVGLDGSKPRILYRNEEVGWAQTYDWSPDGKQILACFSRKDGPEQIVLVSVADGSERILKTFDSKWPDNMCFSPDGHYIVYDFSPKEDYLNRDIFLLSIDGNHEIPLVEHPADDRIFGWSPDGKYILFASNRTGSPDIWTISITDGNPQGVPELVSPSKGPFSPIALGFTRDGSFYYGNRINSTDVYTAEIDPVTGKIIVPPKEAINRFVESNATPEYSPDGKHLAYVSRRPPMPMRYTTNPVGNVLCVRSTETGEEREFRPNINVFGWPRWSPDGRSVLVVGWNSKGDMGYYQIDTQNGSVTPIVLTEGRDLYGGHDWSKDGKSIYYGRLDSNTKKCQICNRDLVSGIEKVLYKSDDLFNISLSPDGQWLTLLFLSNEKQSLNVIPASGGEPRELCRYEKADGIVFGRNCSMTWTKDGKYILYTQMDLKSDDPRYELCRISAEGGESQKFGLKMDEFVNLSVHPNGRHIAFSFRKQLDSEVWVMENFLPGETVAKFEPTTTLQKLAYPLGGYASLSPDGKYICDVDWETEIDTLVLRELATGKMRVLSTTGHAEYSAISPTGTQVAFLCHNPNWENPGLYTIGIDGTDRRCIRNGDCLIPKDWSPDGTRILALEYDKDPKQLVWISVADGSLESVVSVERYYLQGEGHPGKFDVSPDGRFIAYDRLQSDSDTKHDLFILDLNENRETAIASHPSDEKLVGWTPDGRSIFFASYRGGTWDGWLQRITNGISEGFPERIRQNMGDITPIGLTQSGAFYYHTGNEPERDVFVATLDFEKGQVLASPMPVCQTGASIFPAWSPDGRELAYCTGRPGEQKILHIRNLANGQEREIDTELLVFAFPCWSADGRSIVGSAANAQPYGIYKIDVETGERTELVHSATEPSWQGALLSDGQTLLCSRADPNSGGLRYLVRNLTTGREESLVQTVDPLRLGGFALSPDEQWLAYTTSIRGAQVQSLKVVSAKGGEPRTLVQFDESDSMWLGRTAWMPDNQRVLFVKRLRLMDDKGHELWQIPAQGGEPQKVWTWETPLVSLSVHPDGQRIAFHTSDSDSELWVMENFLPGPTDD